MQHFFHHVYSVDYALGDCVFRLIYGAVRLCRVLVSLIRGDILKLISLVSEELIYLLLVLYYTLGYYLFVLDDRSLTWLLHDVERRLWCWLALGKFS